jgi:hypothetical protein
MTIGMGIREYARHRGCTPKAVRKAIDSGRISTLDDGTIDPEIADREWEDNTAHHMRRDRDDD